jgi:hypothetical protein
MFNALGLLLASQNILFLSRLHVDVNTSPSYHNINTSVFVPSFVPILVSSSSNDDSEDENPPQHAHLPLDESVEP